MCQFHSFMLEARKGQCFEVVGEPHHSGIAAKLGISQDGMYLPEFHVDKRALVFDGTASTLQGVMQEAARTQARTNRDHVPANFAAEAWARAGAAAQRDPFNSRALEKLDRYLTERFGTAENLIDFVEPQWGLASGHCRDLLSPEAQTAMGAEERAVTFGIRELSVESTTKAGKVIHIVAGGTAPGRVATGDGALSRVEVMVDSAGQRKLLDATAEKVESRGSETNIHFSVPYQRVIGWMDTVDLAELKFNARLVLASEVDFDAFKRLFKEARYRRAAWKEPVESFVYANA